MKDNNKKKTILIFISILIIVFYLLPLLFKGNIALILLINPLTVLISSILYSKNSGFNLVIVIITALLFLPTIFVFYNESAWIYIVLYSIISLVGSYIGSILNKQ